MPDSLIEAALKFAPQPEIEQDLIKTTIKTQFQKMIEPYLGYIAPLLAFIFYSAVMFFVWILSILLPAILSLMFLVMEKSGIIKFTSEMREVKKLIT